MAVQIKVNEKSWAVDVAADTPLLYVLTNELQLHGPRFGCGLAQCGSCSVLIDGVERRSCVTPVSGVAGKSITTLEGLPVWYAVTRRLARAPERHPVQQALLDEQAGQCGYCLSGIIVSAKALLDRNPAPTRAEIAKALDDNICRCGSHNRILRAVERAAQAAAAQP